MHARSDFQRIAQSRHMANIRAMINQTLTKEEKVAVIQRGMARLPAMGEEAKWAFGVPMKSAFVVPPLWVRRVALLSFNIDPDAPVSTDPANLLKASKMLGSLVGFAEGAGIVLRPNMVARAEASAGALDEEKLRKCIAAAARPHLAEFAAQTGAVRQAFGQKTAEQYASFTTGQSEAAQAIAAEEKEPGITTDMTQDLLMFLWTFWPEIPTAGSVQKLHRWITDLGYLHCSEELVEKVCRKAQLRLSKRGRKPNSY